MYTYILANVYEFNYNIVYRMPWVPRTLLPTGSPEAGLLSFSYPHSVEHWWTGAPRRQPPRDTASRSSSRSFGDVLQMVAGWSLASPRLFQPEVVHPSDGSGCTLWTGNLLAGRGPQHTPAGQGRSPPDAS